EALILAHPEAEAYYIRFMSFYADLIGHVAGLPDQPVPHHVSTDRPTAEAESPEPKPAPAAVREPETPPRKSPVRSPGSPSSNRDSSPRHDLKSQGEKAMNSPRKQWTIGALLLVLVLLGTPAAFQFFGWLSKSRDVKEKEAARNTQRE